MTTGSIARNVHDRIDVLLLGRSAAAQHRVTRLLDPAWAAAERAEAYRLEATTESASRPRNEPLNLARVVGGKRDDGYRDEYVAQLAFDNNPHDANAVIVMIDAHPVGWIARGDAANVRNEINAINPEGLPVTCKAKIVGGWDRGDGDEWHFGVKLSLSRPIKVVPRQRLPA